MIGKEGLSMAGRNRKKSQGSITVFMALILSLVVSLICTGIESVRMAAARTQILAGMDIGLYSLFAQYDQALLKEYDLFALDVSNGTEALDLAFLCDELEKYMKPVLKQNSQKLKLQQCGLTGYRLLTDQKGEVFFQQITEYMKETLGSHGIQLLLDKMQERNEKIRKAEEEGNKAENGGTLESYDHEMSSAARESEEEQKKQEANSEFSEELGDGSQKEDNTGTQVVQADNPIPSIRRIRWMGILDLLLPPGQQVSDKEVSKRKLVSGREIQSGMPMRENLKEDTSTTSQILYQQYLMEKLGNYSDPGKGGLSYQIEYVLYGRDSDRENLKAVARKLLLIREGVNAACLAADPVRQGQASALAASIASGFLIPPAAPVIEAALILCWAFGESVLDVRELFAGGKVPLIKSGENWQLSLENLPHLLDVAETERKESPGGMNYEDYLQILLLSMNRENKKMRGMDMVELVMRTSAGWESFRLDGCVTALEASADVKANTRKVFSVAREYSY